MADINSGIYSMPPVVLSQDISQTYWLWSGTIGTPVTNAPPTSPADVVDTTDDPIVFTSSTNELDRYRVLFLVIGIVIGAMVLGKR